MSVDINQINDIRSNFLLKETISNDHVDTKNILNTSLENTRNYTLSLKVPSACNWIEWNEFWLSDKLNRSRITNSYPRRKLINVNLGNGQIGSEASFVHPAVVLYEESDWLLIAPITSKKYGKKLDLLIDIPPGSCKGLNTPSTIQLDHIRAVSKKRITGTRPGTLPLEYMDMINETLTKKYCPPLYQSYLKLSNENKNLKETNENLLEQIAQLEQQLNNK